MFEENVWKGRVENMLKESRSETCVQLFSMEPFP
jgi:hypothetical protein